MINRHFIACFVLLFAATTVSAQYNKTLSYISKGKYEKAHKKVYDDYVGDPENVELNYSLAALYSTKGFHAYDLRLAYEYAKRTETFYLNIVAANPRDKRIAKWNQIGITIPNITLFKKSMARKALQDAYNSEDPHLLSQYATLFADEPEFADEARRIRDFKTFEQVKRTNNPDNYRRFIDSFPDAIQVGEARQRLAEIRFNAAKAENSVATWRAFLKECPHSIYDAEAKETIDKLAYQKAMSDSSIAKLKAYLVEFPEGLYRQTVKSLYEQKTYSQQMESNDVNQYIAYIQQNTDSSYREKAIDKLLNFSMQTKNLTGIIFFIQNFPEHPHYPKAFLWLYESYTGDGEIKSINSFEQNFPDTTFAHRLADDKKTYEQAVQLGLTKPFQEKDYKLYKQILPKILPKELGFVALQHSLEDFLRKSNYAAAIKRIKTYENAFPPEDTRYNAILQQLSRPRNSSIKPTDLTFLYDSFTDLTHPILSPDSEALYFTGRKLIDTDSSLNIFVSYWFEGKWTEPKPLNGINTPEADEYLCDLSEDGLKMLYSRNGDIYTSAYNGMEWIISEKLPSPINSVFYETDAYWLPQESGMFFVSDRPGGFNTNRSGETYHGNNALATDIYIVLKTANGWGNAILLPGNINSRYCERTPTLSPDGKTLYFSSDGHSGLGKLEILEAHRLNDHAWDAWSNPVLLDKEINSPYNDLCFRRSTDGLHAIYSQESNGRKNRLIDIPAFGKTESKAVLIEGVLVNEYKDPVDGVVEFASVLSPNEGQSVPFSTNQKSFLCKLKDSTRYYIYATHARGFSFVKEGFAYEWKAASPEVVIYNLEELAMQSRSLNIPFLFDTVQHNLLSPLGIKQLQILARVLKSSPYMLTIAVHSERFGETKECYNRSVSQANAIKNYLLTQGVRSEKMIATGYGDLRPLPGNIKTNRIEFSFAK